MADLRVGIAGAGVFGRYHSTKVYGASGVTFAGVYDPDTARAAALAAPQGGQAMANYGDLLSACDAVILATPASQHGDMVEAALRAGCHVLVEKPLAMTFSKGQALCNLAERMGRVLQVGHQERLVLKAMGLLRLSKRPKTLTAVREGPAASAVRVGDVSVVWDLMIHDLDLAVQLMGGVAGELDRLEVRSGVTAHADDVRAQFTFPGGRCASFSASRMQKIPTRSLDLDFDGGAINLDFLKRQIMSTTSFYTAPDPAPSIEDPLKAADEAFFEACRSGVDSPVPGRSVLPALTMAEAISNAL